jgi:hypothetical protein
MSAKNNGPIRVGSGRYDWYFTPDVQCKVKRLIITIDVMQILPETNLDIIMGWLTTLPYPWCSAPEAIESMPALKALAPVRQYLTNVRPLPTERVDGSARSAHVPQK